MQTVGLCSWGLALTLLLSMLEFGVHHATARPEDKRTAVSLGIRMHDGRMAVLLPRHTALPAKVSRMFSNGDVVEILAGEHPLAKDNHCLGLLHLSPQVLKNAGSMRLSFEIDLAGLLTATAEEEYSGRVARRSFESCRDIQNVLASVESRGSWGVLTATASKLKAHGVSSPPVRTYYDETRSSRDNELVGASSATDLEPSATASNWRMGQQASSEESIRSPSLVLTLLSVAMLLTFGIKCWKRKEAQSCDDTVSVEQLLARVKTVDPLAARQLETKYREQRVVAERLFEELKVARLLLDQQREEIEASQQVDDLAFIVYDEMCELTRMRFVKIQCPGVTHDNIEIEIVVNGVVVKITRDASRGMRQLNWTKRFQFPLEEGHFEFKEDQVDLALGVLHLAFKPYMHRPRVFRLPVHHLEMGRTVSESSAGASSRKGINDKIEGVGFRMLETAKFPSEAQIHPVTIEATLCSQGLAASAVQPSAASAHVGKERFPLGDDLSGLPTESSRSCSSCANSSLGSQAG